MVFASSPAKAGIVYGIIAYGSWGLVPLYFNQLKGIVDAKEIICHRIIFSMLLLSVIITIFGRWGEVKAIFRQPKHVLMLTASALFVAVNWYGYVYAATTNQVTQASLGYFILPIVNAIVGITVFRERLTWLQGLALGLAFAGLAYMVYALGIFPKIGVFLAVTFAIYGIIRKVTPVDGVLGLSIETIVLTPIAFVLLGYWEANGGIGFYHVGWRTDLTLAASGLVTTIPLICFAQAVRRVSLISLGFMQYLSPSLQLIIAIFINGEIFSRDHQITFALIWSGLGLLFIEALVKAKRKKSAELISSEAS